MIPRVNNFQTQNVRHCGSRAAKTMGPDLFCIEQRIIGHLAASVVFIGGSRTTSVHNHKYQGAGSVSKKKFMLLQNFNHALA